MCVTNTAVCSSQGLPLILGSSPKIPVLHPFIFLSFAVFTECEGMGSLAWACGHSSGGGSYGTYILSSSLIHTDLHPDDITGTGSEASLRLKPCLEKKKKRFLSLFFLLWITQHHIVAGSRTTAFLCETF